MGFLMSRSMVVLVVVLISQRLASTANGVSESILPYLAAEAAAVEEKTTSELLLELVRQLEMHCGARSELDQTVCHNALRYLIGNFRDLNSLIDDEDDDLSFKIFEDMENLDDAKRTAGAEKGRSRNTQDGKRNLKLVSGPKESEEMLARSGKRAVEFPRSGKRAVEFPRSGKREVGISGLEKRKFGAIKHGNRAIKVSGSGKRDVVMPQAGKRGMGMLRSGKREFELPRSRKREFEFPRSGKRGFEQRRASKQAFDMAGLEKHSMERPRSGKRGFKLARYGQREVELTRSERRENEMPRSERREIDLPGSGKRDLRRSGRMVVHPSDTYESRADKHAEYYLPRSSRNDKASRYETYEDSFPRSG